MLDSKSYAKNKFLHIIFILWKIICDTYLFPRHYTYRCSPVYYQMSCSKSSRSRLDCWCLLECHCYCHVTYIVCRVWLPGHWPEGVYNPATWLSASRWRTYYVFPRYKGRVRVRPKSTSWYQRSLDQPGNTGMSLSSGGWMTGEWKSISLTSKGRCWSRLLNMFRRRDKCTYR